MHTHYPKQSSGIYRGRFCAYRFATAASNSKGRTMQQIARKETWSNRFDEIDRELQLKQVLDSLEIENNLLKRLVVRLSATIIKNVVNKR
jgi:hypothetical protein